MTKEEAIKFLQQLYPNGGHCWLDEQRIEAIGMAIKALQEEPASEEQVKELTKTQHIKETCKENGDSLTQEPVSEDLEKVSKEWLASQLDKSYANYGEGKMMELTHFDGYAMLDAIEFGANWQKQQILDSNTTLQRTFELGKQKMKQHLMAKAVDGTFSTGELADGTPIDAIFNFDKV